MPSDAEGELRAALWDSYSSLTAGGVDVLVIGEIVLFYHLDGQPTVDHREDLAVGQAGAAPEVSGH